MKNFYIHTMGCKSNQFEGTLIAENLIKHGMQQVQNIEEADYFILNSCSVTHKSDNEAMYLLRNAKRKNFSIITVLTGCIAQIEKEKLLENEFINVIVGNDDKLDLFKILLSGEKCYISNIMALDEFHKVELNDFTKTRASLKIQDGCDNRCSYCIIPYARGKSRSADIEYIIEQIKNLEAQGFKEVIFTGIHIGQWGKDIGLEFIDLLRAVENRTQIARYRLGSLNPLEITDELLNFLVKSKKFCPHFHLSLQSACDKTLRSMNRFYKVEDYLTLINKINNLFDLPFLGSDIIAGFAGESEKNFDITKMNLESSGLTQIHTFPYSIRQGTVGATLNNQVSDLEKERRAKVIKEISKIKYKQFTEKNIGKVHEVLVEKRTDKNTGMLKGITRNYLTVYLDTTNTMYLNTLQSVRISHIENGKIYGVLQ